MSETLGRLRRRLAKVERRWAIIQKQKRRKPGGCNCLGCILADPTQPEKFAAEMNLECPNHEFRDLGWIMGIEHIGGGANPAHSRLNVPRLHELLTEYRARKLAAKRKALQIPEYDTEGY